MFMNYISKEIRDADIKAVYKTVNGTDLPIWIYLPKKIRKNADTVVCIHGGAWEAMRKETKFDGQTMRWQADYFSQKGDIGVVISYRSIYVDASIRQLAEDCADAVSYLVNEFDFVNRENIVLMGDSAGAQLAFILTQKGMLDFVPRAAVLCNPVSDLNEEKWHMTSKNEKERTEFSPVCITDKINTRTSFLLMHGERDTVVDISDTERLYELLKEHGKRVRFEALPAARHAFILFNYEEDDETVCGYMEKIEEFLDSTANESGSNL